jgi:thioredoxin 1
MANAVKDDNFEAEVLKSGSPVLVDFWAEWCGPCKALAPVIDDLASEMSDQLKIVKLNIEDAPETPTKYGIRGVPTLMLFKDGEVVDTRVGGMPKDQLKAWIESNI